MDALGLTLPLQNLTLVFAIVLCIILLAPLVSKFLHIPSIIVLIIAGIVFGPNGLNVLAYDKSFELLGRIGVLYIMFLSGIEIDLDDFKQNRNRSLVFGLYTFFVPMILGIWSGHYLLHFSFGTATLLASMYASHTLMAYPIVSRYGILKNRAVNITIGGTMLTVALALFVLAVVVGFYRGDTGGFFWLRLVVFSALFAVVVIFIYPRLAQWFFKRFGDNVLQFIFVLALVFIGAFLAELAGLEGILGAFLVGLSLNKFIPNLSPLMNRINFVGNALFIPFFLIGVGMLVDVRVFAAGHEALLVAAVMTIVATLSKWLAAYFTQRTFRLTRIERSLIFGLSNAQAAATLAAVMIGYDIILPNGNHLLNENVVNGTIIMILFTCAISSFITERAAQRLAMLGDEQDADKPEPRQLLIPISNPDTCDALMELAVLVTEKGKGAKISALSVQPTDADHEQAQKLLERAVKIGASADHTVEMAQCINENVANGIVAEAQKRQTTDLVLGMHQHGGNADSFFGSIIEHILHDVPQLVCVYRPLQPINTIHRIMVAVPMLAERESGFVGWFDRIGHLTRQTGAKICFYTNDDTESLLRQLCARSGGKGLTATFNEMDGWEDFLVIAKDLKPNDLLVVIAARKSTISYHQLFEKLPSLLDRFFGNNGFLVIFPNQEDVNDVSGMAFDLTKHSHNENDFSLPQRLWHNINRRIKAKKQRALR